MAWIYWKLVLSMHVKWLSNLTKPHVCGKLLKADCAGTGQERSAGKFLKLAERRKHLLLSRRKPQSACAVTSGYPDAPSTRVQRLERAPGHPDDPPLKYGIIREHEDETGESQPDARSVEGCDSPCRIRVRAL